MQLFVRGLDGRTFTLQVDATADASAIKTEIRRRTELPESRQRLTHRGKPWRRGTLKDLGASNGAECHLNARLRGGCLPHSLKLYLRCLHMFKTIIAFYMFIMGATIISDYSIHQAYGTIYVGLYGPLILMLSILKPCNILMGHYGSTRHNKFALLLIIAFDGTAIFLQIFLGAFFLADGSPDRWVATARVDAAATDADRPLS